jgi:deoxyribodipyrimidine photo-lyase
MTTSTNFEPTRAAGLARLHDFLPRAGRAYAADRNSDLGPENRANVSTLSPYLRHRLVTEAEVLEAVLGRFSLSTAEKFVHEVYWRTYWKGWLETRPAVWRAYQHGVVAATGQLNNSGGLAGRYEKAVSGRTGIEGFDAWAGELVTTGYMHNHARMWFASIWIFTLRLPWELGADFFYRHLLDGDPASNTLSWRWVAGLHTRGKTYLARADNIASYTAGRFRPTGLARTAEPLDEPPLAEQRAVPKAAQGWPEGRFCLLLGEDDLHPESLSGDAPGGLAAIATAHALPGRSPLPVSEPVRRFTLGALENGLARAADHFGAPAQHLGPMEAETLVAWTKAAGAAHIVAPYAPVGPCASALAACEPALKAAGITLVRLRRNFDTQAWPHCTRGFFALKAKIPDLLETMLEARSPVPDDPQQGFNFG